MMRNAKTRWLWVRLWVASGSLLALGSCLSDQQLASILQSTITTGLTTIVTTAIGQAFGAGV